MVLNSKGTNLGRMVYRDAQGLARQQNLDLIQVNKSNSFPVFKIMDHGKYKYLKNKQKQKKGNHVIKEVNFKVRIDTHDQQIKINHIKKFLSKRLEVKISVIMKGREKSNPTMAHDKMKAILFAIKEFGQVLQIQSNPHMVYASVKPIDSKRSIDNGPTNGEET